MYRRTAKSGIEQAESDCGVPGDVVGGGSDRQLRVRTEAVDREGGVVDCSQAGGESGPPGVVAILVPPPILQKVEAVFQPPVIADMPQEVRSGDALGIETRDEISHVVRKDCAVVGANLAVNTQRYAATAPGEPFANVVGVLQVNP